MSYSITSSNKILTLAIAPFLFISVDVLCGFAISGTQMFYCPHRKKKWTLSLWLSEGDRCTYLTVQLSKKN